MTARAWWEGEQEKARAMEGVGSTATCGGFKICDSLEAGTSCDGFWFGCVGLVRFESVYGVEEQGRSFVAKALQSDEFVQWTAASPPEVFGAVENPHFKCVLTNPFTLHLFHS